MRWDYPPLDINPVFPGLGETIIITIIIAIIVIIVDTIITNIIIVRITNIITYYKYYYKYKKIDPDVQFFFEGSIMEIKLQCFYFVIRAMVFICWKV